MTLKKQLEQMERDNDRLRKYEKLLESIIKDEFGCSRKELHKLTSSGDGAISLFELQICQFFGLKTEAEKERFCEIMLTQQTHDYYRKSLERLAADRG